MNKRRIKKGLLTSCFLLLSACAEYRSYTPAPLEHQAAAQDYEASTLDAISLQAWLTQHGVASDQWPRTQWDIDSLVLVGEFYSKTLALEKAKVAVAEAAEITASQQQSPEISLNTEYHSDRSDGISPWTLGGLFSWVYVPAEKYQTRIDYAKSRTEVEKLRAAEVKWQIRDDVVDYYLAVLVANQKKNMLLAESVVLQSILDVWERSLALGQVSDFELSKTRLELQQSQLAISAQEGAQVEARTQLALAAGLPADALLDVALEMDYFAQLPEANKATLARDTLQNRALSERADIRRLLAGYVVAEADVHRIVAEQAPDITLSPGFIFDQSDNIWALASSFVLPLENLHAGPIAEAEARRNLKAVEILALQTKVLQEIDQSRIRYQTALQAIDKANGLIAEIVQQQKKAQRQYDLGEGTHLSLVRLEFEYLVALRSRYLLEESAWHAFAGIEDAVMRALNEDD